MSQKECPSCGSIIEDKVLICPACGKQLYAEVDKKRSINKELESLLFTVNTNAEACLAKSLGAGPIGASNYEKLNKCEGAYLEIIQRFPTEPKAYLAYVDYMIKYVVKINSLTSVFATTQYFIGDVTTIVNRCRNYLEKAKEFASDEELVQVLTMESKLSQKIEAINADDSIKTKQEKNKKIAKWCIIGTVLFFVIIGILTLIVDATKNNNSTENNNSVTTQNEYALLSGTWSVDDYFSNETLIIDSTQSTFTYTAHFYYNETFDSYSGTIIKYKNSYTGEIVIELIVNGSLKQKFTLKEHPQPYLLSSKNSTILYKQ